MEMKRIRYIYMYLFESYFRCIMKRKGLLEKEINISNIWDPIRPTPSFVPWLPLGCGCKIEEATFPFDTLHVKEKKKGKECSVLDLGSHVGHSWGEWQEDLLGALCRKPRSR